MYMVVYYTCIQPIHYKNLEAPKSQRKLTKKWEQKQLLYIYSYVIHIYLCIPAQNLNYWTLMVKSQADKVCMYMAEQYIYICPHSLRITLEIFDTTQDLTD